MRRRSEPILLHNTATQASVAMAKFPGLSCRNGCWTLRVRVPDAIRPVLGKTEVWRSFGRVDYKQALREARIARVEIDAEFEKHRTTVPLRRADKLSESDLADIARAYFQELERSAGTVPISRDDAEVLSDVNDEDLIALTQNGIEDASLQLAAKAAARWARVEIQEGSPSFFKLCHAVHRALLEHHRRQHQRLNNEPTRVHDGLFASPEAGSGNATTISLSAAIKQFMAASERRNIAPKTRQLYDARLALLADLIGPNKCIASISRLDLRNALDVLRQLPPNAKKRFPGLSIAEVVKAAEREALPRLSPKNVTLHVDLLASLFSWLEQEEVISRNPARKLRAISPTATDEDHERPPFKMEQLNKLFAAVELSRTIEDEYWYWMPRIALFSGMRLAEIAGLKRSDIQLIDGHHVFNVQANTYRGLKRAHNKRLVPIHSALIELGIMKLRADGGDELLLPGLPRSNQSFSHAIQKAMARRIKSALGDKSAVFHSFRHNFRDATREAQMPREIAARLGGWKEGASSVMDGYGSGPSVKLLSEWMEKLHFPDLTL